MTECYIYHCLRSPIGKGNKTGSLHTIKPIELAAQILKSLIQNKNIPSNAIEDIILGNATNIGEQGGPLAKTSALHAGFSPTVSGLNINRYCASSLEALNLSAAKIMCGQNQLLIAAGVESMSRVPMGLEGGSHRVDPEIAINHQYIPQGVAADLLASLKRFSRRDLDQWAVASHQKATKAQERNFFKKLIIPIKDKLDASQLSYDELVRSDTTMESLATLEPSFHNLGTTIGYDHRALSRYPELEKIEHLHHAGNTCSVADGSSAVLLGNERIAKKYAITPKAKVRAFATGSGEPTLMFSGLNNAIQTVLKNADLELSDIDLFEINEPFSSVVLNTIDEFDLDPDKVNVNGGVIALGHALGSTGAMLTGHALCALEESDQRLALIAIGTLSGMGVATIIERLSP